MPTRTELMAVADHNMDVTLTTFIDTVMQSSATDVEKAKIIQSQRLHSAATRTYIRTHLGIQGDIK